MSTKIGASCDGGAAGPGLLSVPLSLQGPENICLPNTCFSTSVWIVFLSFEVPHSHPFALVQNSIYVQIAWLLWAPIFLWSPRRSEIKFTFFLLLICLISVYFLDQLEEPRRAEEIFFPPKQLVSLAESTVMAGPPLLHKVAVTERSWDSDHVSILDLCLQAWWKQNRWIPFSPSKFRLAGESSYGTISLGFIKFYFLC